MKLREYLVKGTIDRDYFRSKTPFYNGGIDFRFTELRRKRILKVMRYY